MFRELLNFRGVNWWVLLGGLGLNFMLVTGLALFGAYLSETSAFYQQWGLALMVLALFVLCLVAGFITGKTAGDLEVKHAFLSSLGAVVPLIITGVLALNPFQFLMGLVAMAGAMNGGMLATPRRRHSPPPNRE